MYFKMVVVMSCVVLAVIGCSKDEEPEPAPAVPNVETEAVPVKTETPPGKALGQKQ